MQIKYDRNIVNLPQSILKYFKQTSNQASLAEVDQQLTKGYNHIALVVLDGLGLNLLKLHEQQTRFLKSKLKTTLSSVFPPTTAAATTAIMTGLTPYESGYFGWFQYFEDEDIHYTIFTREDYYDQKKAIPKDFFDKYLKRETIFERIGKARLAKTKLFYPKKVDKEGYDTFDEGLKRMVDFQNNHHKTLSYLYSIEPDLSQHAYGITAKEVSDALKSLDDSLKAIETALPNDTLLLITADHGLVDVEAINLFDYHDITSTFEHLPAGEPRATQFFIKEGMQEYFIGFFNEHFSDYFNLYTKEEFLCKKLLGEGEKSPLIDTCLGDFIAIAKDRFMFQLSDEKSHLAHHAGMSRGELDVPLFMLERKD